MNKSYKISVISLGCAKNQYDLEASLAEFIVNGYEIVYELEEADFIVINTCSFIESARKETYDAIEESIEAKNNNPNIKIIVCGCYPQKFEKELLEKYGNDIYAYCGIEMHKYIMDIIDSTKYKSHIELPGEKWFEPKNGRLSTNSNWTDNLKISEGCNNRCSYCAIPSIRGNLRSRPLEYILNEAKAIANNGVLELNIIAQDITAYGKDLYNPNALSELLYKLNEIDELKWIRLMYAYPTEISDTLINTIKECDKVLNYIDIPLQHGDNEVLKDMNRRGTREEYLDLVYKLRENIPNICLRTTFIVGYPTETDKAFDNLIDFVNKAQFDRAGFFTYSREINTPAYAIKTQILESIKEERANILGKLLQNISYKKNKSFIGKTLDVLFEDYDNKYLYGRTYRDAIDIDGIIKVKGNKKLLGKIATVNITEADIYDLEGSLE